MRNQGRWSITRASMSSLPSSARIDSEAEVKALVIEAIENSVSASTGSGFPASRRPQPPANTTSPSLTTATAIPGTLKASRTASTWASSPASAGGTRPSPDHAGPAPAASRQRTSAASSLCMVEFPRLTAGQYRRQRRARQGVQSRAS